jgi:phosphate transport system substrate-binding protein
VLIFAVVVDDEAGVDRLTTDQIRAIMSGAVTSWSQLGGADLPIRIVGRGPDSGSRSAVERYAPPRPARSGTPTPRPRGPAPASWSCPSTARGVLFDRSLDPLRVSGR